jgi:hypothetical protein
MARRLPASGFTRMPFASTTLGAEQPLLASELLGYDRDPLAPIKDAVTSDGDVVIPIDAASIRFWLKAAFGAPTTSGITTKTPTFQSGNWALPSFAIETSMPELPRYAMYAGCKLDSLSWQMGRSGLLTATARIIAQGISRRLDGPTSCSPANTGGGGKAGQSCEVIIPISCHLHGHQTSATCPWPQRRRPQSSD